MERSQSLENHVRWHPIYHFVLGPLLLLNALYAIVQLVLDFSVLRGEYLFISLALVVMTLLLRVYPLRVQDRLIRLEERLRFREVLAPDLALKAMDLKPSHYIGLRFASDEELDDLVTKVANGEISDIKEIKAAVTKWRADWFRV